MNEKNQKEMKDINENIELQKKVADCIINSNYTSDSMNDYDGRPLDAIAIYNTGSSRTKLKEKDNNSKVVEELTRIYDIYLRPTIGIVDKDTYFCSTETLSYICGIQKVLTYEMPNARTFRWPILSSIEMKLIDLARWDDEKIKSELGMKREGPYLGNKTFLDTGIGVYLIYSEIKSKDTQDSK